MFCFGILLILGATIMFSGRTPIFVGEGKRHELRQPRLSSEDVTCEDA